MKTLIITALIFIACGKQQATQSVQEKLVYIYQSDSINSYQGVIDSGVNCFDCCPNRLVVTNVTTDCIPSGKLFFANGDEWIIRDLTSYSIRNDSLIVIGINCHGLNGIIFKIPLTCGR